MHFTLLFVICVIGTLSLFVFSTFASPVNSGLAEPDDLETAQQLVIGLVNPGYGYGGGYGGRYGGGWGGRPGGGYGGGWGGRPGGGYGGGYGGGGRPGLWARPQWG